MHALTEESKRALRLMMWIILACAAFAPTLRARFVDYDDREMVAQNPMLTADHFDEVLDSWKGPTLDLYAPLTYSTYAAIALISRATSGALNPALFHAANLLAHAASSVMVFLLMRTLSRDDRASFISALLWAVHPIQAEAVSWVASLNTCLCAMFAIAALLLQTLALTSPARARRSALFILAGAALVLSLCAKPASVGLPLAALGINRFVLGKSWRTTIIISAVGFLLTIPFILLGTSAQPNEGGAVLSAIERLAVVGHTFAFYLYKIVIPMRYCIDYGLSPDVVLPNKWLRFSGLTLLPIIALLIWQKNRRPWLIGAACIFVAAIGPVSGIRNFEFQNVSTVADRYAYFAMLAIALIAAMALRGRLQSRRNFSIAIAIIVLLAAEAFAATLKWHDSRTLDSATIASNPQSLAALVLEGDRAVDEHDLATEEKVYRRFLARRPMLVPVNKAMAYLLLGTDRPGESVDYFMRALELVPDPKMFNDLGFALLQTGNYNAALQAVDAAIELRPGDATQYANKGEILRRSGDEAGALDAFRAALQLEPRNPTALYGLHQMQLERMKTTR